MYKHFLQRLDALFIPSEYSPGDDNYLTGQMCLRVCWIGMATAIAYIPLNAVIGYDIGCVCLVLLFSAFCCVPFILKYTANKTLVVNLLLLLAHSCFVFYISTDGGFPSAGSLFWLSTAPMIAILLSQKTWSIVWLSISILTFVGFFICWLFVGPLPIRYDLQFKPIYSLIVMVGGLVVNFIVMALMEAIRRSAYNKVQRQKILLEQQAQEIQTGSEQLQKKNLQLESLLQQNNDFLGMVVHDLKNPLGSIDGLAKILEDPTLSAEERKEFALLIRQTSAQMLDLVKNLLECNALEQKAILVHPVLCDVVAVVNAALHSYRIAANNKGIDVQFEGPSALFVCLDTALTLQILDNLISNAIKFSETGTSVKVSVGLRGKSMGISSCPDQKTYTCVFEVRDSGPGLTDDDKKKLFGKFVKLSARPTGGEHSTGLGLSIVKTLVHLLDGSIRCESEFGKGASFIVELPTMPVDTMIQFPNALQTATDRILQAA